MNLTPQGVHKRSRPVHFLDSFHPYSILVCFEWFLWVFGIFQGMNIVKNWIFGFFRQNFGVWPPVVFAERVTPWGVCTFSKLYCTYFKNNFDFSWFFMIILVKKPKNVQILAKMRKFKFFHNFKTPQGVDRKPEKKSKNVISAHLGVF